MVKQPELNFQGTRNGLNELKHRLLFLIGAIIVFRVGSFIPIPGINTSMLESLIHQQHGTIIQMFNMFSGGALSRASIFALGIMPYISASIIIQLLTFANSKMHNIKKRGESGKRKISQYICYTTLILAIIQAIGVAISWSNMIEIKDLVINPNFEFYFTAVVGLTCGTIFLMWLSEQISEYGIGNGTSIIIFVGIAAGLPSAISQTIDQVSQGDMYFFMLLLVMFLIFLVTFIVVFIERGQRRIVVNYAKRQQGYNIYTTQSTHLPLKVNMAGVLPAIFASSVIFFPATIISWVGDIVHSNWLYTILFYLKFNELLYMLLYSFTIIFFSFFFTKLVFNPRETADNLKKSGACIPGIRPGEQTKKYIDKVITRLTLFGAIYIAFICLIPEFMRNFMNVSFYFGGTSLLIAVIVVMDFITQVQTLIMSSQYDSILKKANLKESNR